MSSKSLFYGHRKKITVDVPADLLKEAQLQTGEGIADTVRRGLRLLAAAGGDFKELRALRGKVKNSQVQRFCACK